MMRMRERGVSLMEAIVALGVMGFGMLGVAAMQASLRQNADIARQRAEAVRLAQAPVEQFRAYSVVGATAGKQAFDDIDTPGASESITGTNTVYTRTIAVTTSAAFNIKTVRVTVSWTDRGNNTQQVLVATQIHRVPPELGGSLIVPASQALNDGGRSNSPGGTALQLPPGALDLGDGTSSYAPPGGGAKRWIFSNTTGLVTAICTAADAASCSAIVGGRLVQGYMSVALTAGAGPGPAQSENPTDLVPAPIVASFGVSINQTAPGGAPAPECFYEQLPTPTVTTIGYNCLVRVTAASGANSRWSGHFTLGFTDLSVNDADTSPATYRVCRYTRYRNDDVVGTVQGETGLALANADHPKIYSTVDRNLLNQNYLVIRSGDGTLAYDCPDDDAATAGVYGRTWQHQP